MKPIIEFILRRSGLVITLFVLITLLIFSGVRHVRADTGVEGSLPDHNATIQLNDQIKQTFGSNDATIALLEGDIFTTASFDRLYALTKALEAHPDVESVTSLANALHSHEVDGFLVNEDMIPGPHSTPTQIKAARAYLKTSYLYQNIHLVGQDGKSTILIITPKAGVSNATFGLPIRELVAQHWDGQVALAGNSVIASASEKVIKRDLPKLAATAVVLILSLLYLNFRAWQGVALPLLVIVAGVSWGMGLYGWLGQKIMTITIIGPIAVLAVGSSFALHLLGRYFFELAHGHTKQQAIRTTFCQTGQGVMISGVAISAAMLTFLFSALPMVRGLGLLTALGVTSALVAAMLLLPAVLNVLPAPRVRLDPENPGALGGTLLRLADGVSRHRRAVMGVAAVLVLISAYGVTRIVPNTSFLAFFPRTSEVVKGVEAVERAFGASTALSVRVEGQLQDPQALAAMLSFQEQVRQLNDVGAVSSFATVMRNLHEVLSGEPNLPRSSAAVSQELLLLDTNDLRGVVTPDFTQGLINISVKNLPTADTKRLAAQIEQIAARTLAPHLHSYALAGAALWSVTTEQALIHDFILSLTLAVALVIIIDSFIRSMKAALVTIVSLVVTIALQYGLLGLLGLPLNLATMLMGALAIGVGDYAIHLTVRYLEERRRNHAPETAMRHAIYTSGRSITFTALTLGAGFAALIFAGFVPVSTLGSLMVFTVTSVGVASLTLLPAVSLTFLRHDLGGTPAPAPAPASAD